MPIEDFTAYTEEDIDGNLAVAPDTVTVTTMGHCDDESYIWLDKDAGNIGDFEWLIKLAVTDVDAGDGSGRLLGILLGATTVHGDLDTFPSDDCIFIELWQQADVDDTFRIFLRENVNEFIYNPYFLSSCFNFCFNFQINI